MENGGKNFSIYERIASLLPAIRGIKFVLMNEHNAWIHLTASIAAIILGIVFNIGKTEWLVILLCIGFVMALEVLNSAIEKLVDLVSPGKNEKARLVKDISAGAVLIAAVISLIAGLIIFIPHVISVGKLLMF
jgi:diacylglycerol kinase (ATP)